MSPVRPQSPVYADLEIRLLPPEPEGYPVEITLNDGQQFPRGYLKCDLLPWAPSGSPAADGERLFDRLLADDRLKTAWAEARGRHPFRRVRLRIDDAAPELHAIPWELLRDAGPGSVPQALAADTATPFSRYLAGPWHPRAPVEKRPFKLLVAVPDPTDLPSYGLDPVDARAEQEVIRAVGQGVSRNELEVTFLESPVTLAALEAELRKGYHALHIVAHGALDGSGGPALLLLADAANHVAFVQEDELAEMLARQGESLQLVFLDACQGAARSPADAFRGFAPRLIATGIPAVLAMQDVVPAETGRKFTRAFYRQLLQHGQVDLASNEARSALLSEGEARTWGIPALYSRVQDGLILEPLPQPATPWERVRRLPVVAKALAVGGALLSVLSVLAMLLGLPNTVQTARQPGGALAALWPAPTATFTPTPTQAPTATAPPTPSPTPVPPMADGFNLAVAEFTALDEPSTHVSRQLSEWLFAALRDQLAQVTDLNAHFRGPDQIGAVPGVQPETRTENAIHLAQLHNVSLLIYGAVTTAADGGYYMEPAFYISSKGFRNGSEVVGPDRLGEKVRFDAEPLADPAALGGVNQELTARLRVLQSLSRGLVSYYLGNYRDAYAQFDLAAADWGTTKGLEVVDVLKGAAELRVYDAATEARARLDALQRADEAFTAARELNPGYARSYLGLGAVAMQRVPMATTEETQQEALIAAQQAYSMSLTASDQPPTAYVPANAAFGLGQVHLKGVELGLPGWSADQARSYFQYVLREYSDKKQPPDLTWRAGHARAYLGWIAGLTGDWVAMATGYREAIDILSRMPGGPPINWIAVYWSHVAFAEEQRGNLQDARDAYRAAIENGQKVLGAQKLKAVDPATVAQWQQALDRLEKGAP